MFSPDNKVEWQLPPASISDRHWDVVVIGAGPAGAIAAYHLAAAGNVCGQRQGHGIRRNGSRILAYGAVFKRFFKIGELSGAAVR
jgi:hypothetical protein